MKLLYDSLADGQEEILDGLGRLPLPEGKRILLMSTFNGRPEEARAAGYEGRAWRHENTADYVPGLDVAELASTCPYSRVQPCTSLVLYYDGTDLKADAEHPYGTSCTVVRFMRQDEYKKLWKHISRAGDDRKSWYKLLRHTESVPDALPEIMALMRPCRIVPTDN